MTAADAQREADRLLGVLSQVADGLYRIDAEPECRLLRDPSSLEGVSAALAEGLADAFGRIWQEYPRAKQQADDAAGDPAALLAGDFAARVTTLAEDVGRILAAAAQIGDAWRRALPTVDDLRTRLATADEQAARLGLTDDADLVHAHRLLDHLAQQTARDPLSVDPSPASDTVDAVATRLAEMESLHDELPARLVEARATVDEIRRLLADGRTALVATRERVKDPAGLLEPLPATAVDDGERALAPWLERIEDEARAGRWFAAAKGLQQWNAAAADWRARAIEVVTANQAPVEHRNELRGLLDAYRAKAAATGQAEDRTLTEALQRTRDALFTAPCDLEEAERLVQDYGRMVSDER